MSGEEMSWQRAAGLRADTIESLSSGRLAGALVADKSSVGYDPDTCVLEAAYPGGVTQDISMALLMSSLLGEFYWVSPDMVRLVVHAAQTLPDEPLLRTDAPTPSGVCVLAEPITIELDDEDRVQLGTGAETAQCCGWMWVAWPQDVGGVMSGALLYLDNMKILFPIGLDCMPFGGSPVGGLSDSKRGPDDFARRVALRAFWTISQQKLAATTSCPMPRIDRRRLVKAGAQAVGDVTLVWLRRAAEARGSAGHDVEWSRRWMVSGHWRNQWLASVKNHRQQWIAPYVKGPSDKPLIVSEKVTLLAR